jgi:hypothetical protein
MNDHSTTGLPGLLARLETKAAEDFASQTFTGHALSKTETALHLAIPSGILSIPFSEIKKVDPVVGMGPEWVSIVVGNADKASYLRRSLPLDAGAAGSLSGQNAGALFTQDLLKKYSHAPIYAMGSTVQMCVDTATVTGNGYDATDDGQCWMQVVDPGSGGL